jgi:hypothetical protein
MAFAAPDGELGAQDQSIGSVHTETYTAALVDPLR